MRRTLLLRLLPVLTAAAGASAQDVVDKVAGLEIEGFETTPHPAGIVPANLLPVPPACLEAVALDDKQAATFREAMDRAKLIQPPEEARARGLLELKRLLRPKQTAALRAWYTEAELPCPLDPKPRPTADPAPDDEDEAKAVSPLKGR